jgi:hypothetical protein
MYYEITYGRIDANGTYHEDGLDNNFFKGYTKEEAEQKIKDNYWMKNPKIRKCTICAR